MAQVAQSEPRLVAQSLLRQRSALEETGERSETSGGNSLHESLYSLEVTEWVGDWVWAWGDSEMLWGEATRW